MASTIPRKAKQIVMRFWTNELGTSAAEYALILAVIGAGIALGASSFASEIRTVLSNLGAEIVAITY